MNFYEMICFAKVYNTVMGQMSLNSVTKEEIKVAIEVLKKMADNRDDWTQEQKECYKLLADFVKEQTK